MLLPIKAFKEISGIVLVRIDEIVRGRVVTMLMMSRYYLILQSSLLSSVWTLHFYQSLWVGVGEQVYFFNS